MSVLIANSHYSVLSSILLPSDIVDIAVKNGEGAAAITDMNSMAGIVQFTKAASKAGIKPVLGVTVETMCNNQISFLAKNLNGYKNLLKLLSKVNSRENFVKRPRVKSENLEGLEDIVCLFGHQSDWENEDQPGKIAKCLRDIFQKDLYLCSSDHSPELFKISKTLGSPYLCCGTIKREDSKDHQYLLNVIKATKLKTKLSNLTNKNDLYYYDNFNNRYRELSERIFESCEEYSIFDSPRLPTFKTPDGSSTLEYLKSVCRESFRRKIPKENWGPYQERIISELAVFEKAGLSDYFMILWGIVNYAQSKNYLVGAGRGSAAGCLISYLLGITKVDPVKFKLIFSRFFNEGRIGSLPDIDVDFPAFAREDIISHIISTYGQDRVGQIATYQTFMGRAAIKCILRADSDIGFGEMNKITEPIQDKSKVADELQDMKDEGREGSVILWALENRADELDQWARLEDGEIVGPLAYQIKMAIELEGIKSAASRHPAGIIISDLPLAERGPVLYDEGSGKQIVGLEYEDAESCGYVKYDCLGLSSLDRMMDINI